MTAISILGGGPAGLAAGYFAQRAGLPFRVFEATSRTGGNCKTFAQGDFLFDSGAHRFHDKSPQATATVKSLMGGDLERVDSPSQIFVDGRFVDFPLSPLDLLRKIGVSAFTLAGLDLVRSRLTERATPVNFEQFAIRTYGHRLARMFLLNYTAKLWGRHCRELSLAIAGRRLQGLDLQTLIREAISGKKAKTRHLDGAFYYPQSGGIGAITDRLADACGWDNLETNAPITRVFHNGNQITRVRIGGREELNVGQLVSTLPLNRLIQMLDPSPPEEVVSLANSLSFRHLRLVALFLRRRRMTPNASIYFPQVHIPFTRLCEPINRNERMAPTGQTSLVVEIPCDPGDAWDRLADEPLTERITDVIIRLGWVSPSDICGSAAQRLSCAYPVLDTAAPAKCAMLIEYLEKFENLYITGRNALFEYSHLHDLMDSGKRIIDRVAADSPHH